MLFWLIVLAAAIGAPIVGFVTCMGMIFWAAGLAGGPQESRAPKIVRGWFALAWVLAAACVAFGLAPAWHAWRTGEETLDGSLQVFVNWLVGLGAAGLAIAFARRVLGGRRGAGASLPQDKRPQAVRASRRT